ncbi:MAG: TPM domain-containing protein [Actinomycetaceae bacterium]|nr:TPM domain-containing protein [Actinomycetaceae bacterium]
MKLRSSLTALLTAFLVVLFVPNALAAGPVLITDRVTDQAGVFQQNELSDLNGVVSDSVNPNAELYVVFVPSFDSLSSSAWCQNSARKSQLSAKALVLAVATQDHKYDFCYGSKMSLSAGAKRDIGTQVKARLSAQDWAGAVRAAATSVAGAGEDGAAAPSAGAASHSEGGWGATLLGYLLVPFLAIAGFLGIGVWAKTRGKRKANTSTPAEVDTNLLNQAGALAMQADTAVRNASEDLEFARTQFGHIETEQYQQALKTAGQMRDEALVLLQKMQQTGAPPAKQQLAQQVISLSQQALNAVAAQQQSFDSMRDLERNADSALAEAAEKIAEVRHELEQARAELANLHVAYPQTNISSIDDNPQLAENLLASAEAARTAGVVALEKGDKQKAVNSVKLTERALTQARTQIRAITTAEQVLADADRALLSAISSISSDIADANRFGQAQVLGVLIAEAQSAIAEGEAARRGAQDPLAALEKLQIAEDALDAALEPMRAGAAADRKREDYVQERLPYIRGRIEQVEAFISGRRGAADGQARMLIAGARQKLNQATAARDYKEVRTLLDGASADAEQAYQLAMNSYQEGDWNTGGRAPGIDMGSLLLGGLLAGGHGWGSGWGSNSGSDWGSDSGSSFGGGFNASDIGDIFSSGGFGSGDF